MTQDATLPATHMVPLREGMFRMPDRLDAPACLLGDRCRKCGESFFPKRVFCAACSSGDMEDVEFASTGEIDTFTIVRQQPPNSVMVPPYAIVRVKLDDGPGVQTVVPKERPRRRAHRGPRPTARPPREGGRRPGTPSCRSWHAPFRLRVAGRGEGDLRCVK